MGKLNQFIFSATFFVDFKSAFDQLWFEGCQGKLIRMGIPVAFVKWIRAWLEGRRRTIEIQGKRSRWFSIRRGAPQGSRLYTNPLHYPSS